MRNGRRRTRTRQKQRSKKCLFKTPSLLGNSSPGSGGGGAIPSAVGAGAANPSILATALTLLPLGLTPIAVFPPYNTPRQIPAISVIFSEDPDIRYIIMFEVPIENKQSLIS